MVDIFTLANAGALKPKNKVLLASVLLPLALVWAEAEIAPRGG